LPDSARGSLDDILGLRLRLAHGAVQRHFSEHFGDLGLTQKQVSVLWLVGETPGTAQTDIAQRLQMDRATTMAIVHALEKRGLLVRRRAERDARKIAFMLSDNGELALATARRAIGEHEAWLRGRFTKTEIATLVGLLDRIHG
jgi:DNA-binding MarR family transcriptional regulator